MFVFSDVADLKLFDPHRFYRWCSAQNDDRKISYTISITAISLIVKEHHPAPSQITPSYRPLPTNNSFHPFVNHPLPSPTPTPFSNNSACKSQRIVKTQPFFEKKSI
ncbi:hypothetical protein PoB_002649900 [Plakobranchus ocellatus]|uniref:Uncharacterized protein n=1 Tax=Plakobranchus ocellatus TaxID=259542 RepID=A0AAV4A078_9GAST|nr:hypothetical protein PoB_002649900 [Plakobranchus ocellatus]